MASVWKGLREVFWNEWFWLPPSYTWDDLKNTDDGIYRPTTSDLWVPLYVAVAVTILRRIFERLVAIPSAQALGLKERPVEYAPENKILEAAFKKSKKPADSAMQSLAKQTDMSVRQVERWYRKRRNQEKTQMVHKFAECSWRCLFYFFIFWYGLYVLWDKPWFWDSKMCWVDWLNHHVSNDVYWYYAIEAGFYISLLFSQFTDVRRKDFHEMFVHHLVTLGLLFMSWMENLVRIGTLILVVHDAVDYWLEAAKMARYVGKQRLCDCLFVVFALVWVVTRLVIFPLKIIYSCMIHSIALIGFCNIYYVYNILLVILQILHIFWFIIICKVVAVFFRKGAGEDIRSSSEESVSEDEDPSPTDRGPGPISNGPPSTNGPKMENGSSTLKHRSGTKPEGPLTANGSVKSEGPPPTNGFPVSPHDGTAV